MCVMCLSNMYNSDIELFDAFGVFEGVSMVLLICWHATSQFIFNSDYLFFNFQCNASISWVTLVCVVLPLIICVADCCNEVVIRQVWPLLTGNIWR